MAKEMQFVGIGTGMGDQISELGWGAQGQTHEHTRTQCIIPVAPHTGRGEREAPHGGMEEWIPAQCYMEDGLHLDSRPNDER